MVNHTRITGAKHPQQDAPNRKKRAAFMLSTLGCILPALLHPAIADDEVSTVYVKSDAYKEEAATSRKVSTSGTKTATPLSKTPQTVSVVTQEDIEEKGATSVADSLAYSSGVITNYRGSSNRNDEVMARGMSGYLPQYLDGISFASGSSGASLAPQVDPWLLEKVELIHGPASVLYGQSNPGGLVSLTSKRPTAKSVRELEIGMGSDNRRQAAFDFGGSVTDESTVLYRLTGIAKARDGQEQYVEEERYAIAPAITFLPNDQFSFTLLASLQKDPDAGYRNFLPAEGTVLANPNGQIPTSFFVSDPNWEQANREQNSIGYLMEYRANEQLTLRQNTRFTSLKQKTQTVIYDSWADADQAVMKRWAQKFDDEVKSTGIDNQAEYQLQTGALRHTLLGGVDYKRLTYDNRTWSDYDSDGDLDLDWTNPQYGLDTSKITLSAVTDETQKRKQVGAYLQDQIEIGRWDLVLSGRHDSADLEVENRIKGTTIDTSANKTTGRAGALYTFANGIAPYISYGTSFEPITSTDANGEMLDPTTAWQSEVGLKYAPSHRDLQATIAVYDLHQKDVASYDSKTRSYLQTGEVGSQGVELESRMALSEAMKLTASYAYTDSHTLKSETASEVGKVTYWIPRHTGSTWASYSFDNGLTTGAGVRYVGSTYSRNNAIKVPDYTLTDLSVGYDLGKASTSLKGAKAQLTVNNLFDHEYVSSCANDWACFYGEGRSAMAKLGYSW